MSKKKKKTQKSNQSGTKPDVSIQYDPYWKISRVYLDPQRVGRYLNKFERFEDEYPCWTEELLDGTPTFYCILGVMRGATEEEIKEAYDKKTHLSNYPEFLIEEAYDTLSDPDMQKEYDELLNVFSNITKCMPPAEKIEMKHNHDHCIELEIKFERMEYIMRTREDFLNFYSFGMPGLYELIGLTGNSSQDELKKTCEKGSELFKQVYAILGDPDKRSDYDFFMDFNTKYGSWTMQSYFKARRERWNKFDDDVIEKMALSFLTDHNAIINSLKRQCDIMNRNQDWERYLPPGEDTFFSILDLDRRLLSGDKKEVEKTIRDKYRYLEKTPQVNLAYSMLKNVSQRDDYIWLIDNNEMLNSFTKISSGDKNDIHSPEMPVTKKGSKSKQSFDQMTFNDFMEDVLKIMENEID
ncbi:MAG: hypothetical protein ACT6FE_01685 [Methanosarcinaceae archaeon]